MMTSFALGFPMSLFRAFTAVVVLLNVCLQPVGAAETELIRSLEMDQPGKAIYPKNLARQHLGTSLSVGYNLPGSAPGGPANESDEVTLALLSDDATINCFVPVGRHAYIISMTSIQTVNRFSFLNNSAAGSVSIAVSNTLWPQDSPKWQQAQQPKEFAGPGVVSRDLGFREAKYVKVDFDIRQSGHIASFGLFGSSTTDLYRMRKKSRITPGAIPMFVPPAQSSRDSLNCDLAALYAKSRVAYVSSAAKQQDVNLMVDDMPDTGYAFEPGDANPTMILDLRRQYDLRRAVFQVAGPPGLLKLYLLDELPVKTATQMAWCLSAGQLLARPRSGLMFAAFMPMPHLMAQNANNPASGKPNLYPEKLRMSDSFFQEHVPVQAVKTWRDEAAVSADFGSQSARYLMVQWSSAGPQKTEPLVINRVSAFGNESWDVVYETSSKPLVKLPPVTLPGSRQNSDQPQIQPIEAVSTPQLPVISP